MITCLVLFFLNFFFIIFLVCNFYFIYFISNFLLVFLLGVIGFGIALMGLFNDDKSGFPNIKESFFTLFASGMGNFCYFVYLYIMFVFDRKF